MGRHQQAADVQLDKDVALGFDVDDTLLGRNLKDKSKKESLSVERSKLRDALVALSRLEFKQAVFSDNNAEDVKKRIPDPMRQADAVVELPECYSNGMTAHFSVPAAAGQGCGHGQRAYYPSNY